MFKKRTILQSLVSNLSQSQIKTTNTYPLFKNINENRLEHVRDPQKPVII